MDKLNWIRKLAKADLKENRLRSLMTIIAVVIITALSSSCVIVYLSLLNSTDKMISADINFSVSFYIFMIIPVLFCGLLLIIDCFHLNKENAVRQNGLMSSVGLTPKQDRSLLRWQTFYLTITGFVISVILVAIFVYLILPLFIGNFYSDFQVVEFNVVLLVLFGAGIIAMALVNAGLYISFYESDQLSISERIKYTGSLVYRKKEGHKSFSEKKINEAYPKHWLNRTMLAARNYIRGIRNNGHVLASLVFALSTLLMVNIVVSGIHPAAFADTFVGSNDYKLYNATFAFDYREDGSAEELFAKGGANFKSPSKEVFDRNMIGEIENNNEIYDVKIVSTLYMSYLDSEDIDNQYYMSNFDIVDTKYILSRYEEGYEPSNEIVEKFERGEIVLSPNIHKECFDLEYNISGSIMYEGVQGQSYEKAFEKNKFDFSVYSMPDDYAAGNPEVSHDFYIHENILEKIDINPIISSIEFSADMEDRPEVQGWIDEKIAGNKLIGSESRDRSAALAQAQKDAFFLVGYLLAVILVIISFIGFAIVNIVSVDARRNEFFILKCVGMKQSEIRSMLMTEGLIYGIVVLLIMTLVASPFLFLLYNNFKMFYNTYHFPYVLFVMSMVMTLAIVVLVPVLVYKQKN